jgi:hypothetical protein
VVPAAIVATNGVTEIETRAAGVTLSVEPGDVTAPCTAVMIVVPVAIPVATPVELIVAAEVVDEVQVTEFVKF